MTRNQVNDYIKMISSLYRYQLFIDDLPNATMEVNPDSKELEANFKEGIYVGKLDRSDGSLLIYNHLAMTVKTHHVTGGDEMRVVGFEIEPKSIAFGSSLDPLTLD